MLRFDHVGITVQDLGAALEFFVGIGFVDTGGQTIEDVRADRIIGLEGARSEIRMLKPPDGGSNIELVCFERPTDPDGPQVLPVQTLGLRHICVEIADVDGTVARLREQGIGLVGEVVDYGTSYRLCYVRGPEGLIVELAEALS